MHIKNFISKLSLHIPGRAMPRSIRGCSRRGTKPAAPRQSPCHGIPQRIASRPKKADENKIIMLNVDKMKGTLFNLRCLIAIHVFKPFKINGLKRCSTIIIIPISYCSYAIFHI